MDQLFKICTINETDVAKIAASTNPPHNHDFEELIIAVEGKLEHFIDFKSSVFNAPYISFVTKGKMHQVKPETENGICKMWVLGFKSEFIPETTFQLYSFYHDHANIPLQFGPCFDHIAMLCEK